MLETDAQQTEFDTDRGQVLVLRAPSDVDVDLVWDAFLTFVEDLFDLDVCDVEHAAWRQVTPDAFEEAVRTCLDAPSDVDRLYGIWDEDRFAVIGPQGRLSVSDWDALRELLNETAPGQSGNAAPWQVLCAPSDQAAAQVQPLKQQPAQDIAPQTRIPRANRHRPVPATPEQSACLALAAAQPNGQVPTIAMNPVIVDAPDKGALCAAIEALQERHESLFTTFVRHEGIPFIVLDDSTPPPLTRIRVVRPFSSIAARAAQKSDDMAQALHVSGGHWQACLIEARTQAAVVCVFSQAIADHSAVDQFRAELIALYEAFRDGLDPEADAGPPPLQYTDVAALERDSALTVAWWEELLPQGLFAPAAPSLPIVAPVSRHRQDLPDDLGAHLLSVCAQDLRGAEAMMLSAFLTSVCRIEGTPVAWVTLPLRDMHPPGAEGCLGQFTRWCPVWLGDLGPAYDPKSLSERCLGLRTHEPMGHSDLSRALPGRIPARIGHVFDCLPRHSQEAELDQPEDINLTIRLRGDQLAAQWAIRLDHPLCNRLAQLHSVFCDQLARISAPTLS